MSETKLTFETKRVLEKELLYLKEEELPRIYADLEEARLMGDLSENAEYDMARDELAQVQQLIEFIEKKLKSCIIVTQKEMNASSEDTQTSPSASTTLASRFPVSIDDCPSLKGIKLMAPLWLAYPDIHPYSIGWRMGYGEEYKDEFWDWRDTLSSEQGEEYDALFPAPPIWSDPEYENNVLLWDDADSPYYNIDFLKEKLKADSDSKFNLIFEINSNGQYSASSPLSGWVVSYFCESEEEPEFKNLEQYIQFQKALLFDDENIAAKILGTSSPWELRGIENSISNYDEAIWERLCYSVVAYGNYLKFDSDIRWREYLLDTGNDILVYADENDTLLGIGLSKDDPDVCNPEKWKGKNIFGFALMDARDKLRAVYANEYLLDEDYDDEDE